MLNRLTSALSLSSTPAGTPPPSKPTSKSSTPKAPHTHLDHLADYQTLAHKLDDAGVPVSFEDCRGCEDPCDASEGITTGFPKGFDQDWDLELAGSAKPNAQRTVVISTGRSDWDHDHTTDKTTLAYHLTKTLDKHEKDAAQPPPSHLPPTTETPESVASFIAAESVKKDTQPLLLSSSLISQSSQASNESVLLLPDWKVLHEVENSKQGAEDVWAKSLGEGKAPPKEIQSWTLPYRAVVLICSHKKRDKRCHIAAPLLEKALIDALTEHDVSVDVTGDSLSNLPEPPLEEVDPSALIEETERRLRGIESVEDTNGGGEIGIFKVNHLGGHKFAGVMKIHFPSGATLSYGRVSPHEIPRLVEDTLLNGKIVPGLLRSGVGVVRGRGKGFLSW